MIKYAQLLLTILVISFITSFDRNPTVIEVECIEYVEVEVQPDIDILSSVPKGLPVDSTHLNRNFRLMSGFGARLHPIHNIWKMHKGYDLACPKGTPIISTGYGMVSKVECKANGYGNSVRIQHGMFETVYAHMSVIYVEEGQLISMGETIGTVGSTGTATSPHVHYEVRFNGQAKNPVKYF